MKRGILRGLVLSMGDGSLEFTRFGVICDGKNIEIMSEDKSLEESVIGMVAESDEFKKMKKADPEFDACKYIADSFPMMMYEAMDYSGTKADQIRKDMGDTPNEEI